MREETQKSTGCDFQWLVRNDRGVEAFVVEEPHEIILLEVVSDRVDSSRHRFGGLTLLLYLVTSSLVRECRERANREGVGGTESADEHMVGQREHVSKEVKWSDTVIVDAMREHEIESAIRCYVRIVKVVHDKFHIAPTECLAGYESLDEVLGSGFD